MNNSVCSKKVESNWSKQKSKTLSNKVEKFISNSCVDLMPLCKNFFKSSHIDSTAEYFNTSIPCTLFTCFHYVTIKMKN